MVIETNMFVNWLILPDRVVISYKIGICCVPFRIFISKTSLIHQKWKKSSLNMCILMSFALCITFQKFFFFFKFCVNFCEAFVILYFKFRGRGPYLFKIKVALGKMIAEFILLNWCYSILPDTSCIFAYTRTKRMVF